MVEAIEKVIKTLFPASEASATFIANMGATGVIKPTIATRLQWRKRYPNDVFSGTEEQKLQLKYIYLEFGWDWRTDKYLNPPIESVPLPGYCV